MVCRLKHHSGENSDNGSSNRDEEEDAANAITDLGPVEYPKGLFLFINRHSCKVYVDCSLNLN